MISAGKDSKDNGKDLEPIIFMAMAEFRIATEDSERVGCLMRLDEAVDVVSQRHLIIIIIFITTTTF